MTNVGISASISFTLCYNILKSLTGHIVFFFQDNMLVKVEYTKNTPVVIINL